MISVAQVMDSEKNLAEKLLGFTLQDNDKCFVLNLDGDFFGAGVLSYEASEIEVKKIKVLNEDNKLFDILARSMLNTVRDLKLMVKVKDDTDYFKALGFKICGEYYVALGIQINFMGNCCKG